MLSKSICKKCEFFKNKCRNCKRDNCWSCEKIKSVLAKQKEIPANCPYHLEHIVKTQANGVAKC